MILPGLAAKEQSRFVPVGSQPLLGKNPCYCRSYTAFPVAFGLHEWSVYFIISLNGWFISNAGQIMSFLCWFTSKLVTNDRWNWHPSRWVIRGFINPGLTSYKSLQFPVNRTSPQDTRISMIIMIFPRIHLIHLLEISGYLIYIYIWNYIHIHIYICICLIV